MRNYVEAIRLQVESTRGSLEPVAKGVDFRGDAAKLLYVAFFIGVGILFVCLVTHGAGGVDAIRFPTWLILGLVTVIGLGCGWLGFIPLLAIRGFNIRFVCALPGITFLVSLLVYQFAAVPWHVIASEDDKNQVLEAAIAFQTDPRTCLDLAEDREAVAKAIENGDMDTVVQGLRLWFFAGLMTSILILGLSASSFVLTLRSALEIQPYLFRLRRFPERESTRVSTSGHGFLALFRFGLGALWFVLASLISLSAVSSLALLLRAAMGVQIPCCPTGVTECIRRSSAMAAIAMGPEVPRVGVDLLARVCWVI
ncbi:MAG: hypothetical protein ACYSWU_20230, partial [Planctomycetota bacterium]